MKNLDQTAEELFAKIRGRFPGVTIGDGDGNVTQEPTQARFFEFPFREGQEEVGKISVSLSEDDGVVVMYNQEVAENDVVKDKWYDFLKELRMFAKKRMLNFETRDITKSNLEKRDYQYLARTEESTMTESKLYGTSRVSYQNVDNARLVIKHTESVNQELAAGRTQKIGKIYIESSEGERFMYPYKHLSGARAMARHVAEGGKPFDDFGKHIVGLSEELAKLRKFKTYMGRSGVMAESLSGYVDVVKERIATVKKTVESLQKQKTYNEAFETFEQPVFEDVPDDVKENWIDQLTIKQFNEELSDVFPYIYKLVSEATRATELGPDDLVDEGEKHGNSKEYDSCWDGYKKVPGKKRGEKGSCVKEEDEFEAMIEKSMGQFSEAEECEDCGCTPCECESTDEADDAFEQEDKQLPLSEFILSYFDRDAGQFPKGETAILTMVEKDYGEEFIDPAKAFIARVDSLVSEMHGYKEADEEVYAEEPQGTEELNDISRLAGL